MNAMKVLGITAEYNPFHNGHKYQMDMAAKQVRPDRVVIAMSGDFTQRGEPAILDKWTRSKDAVLNGADVVFELPFIFACNRAEAFASGGVDLLASAGATHISFGCETEDFDSLYRTAEAVCDKKLELDALTAENKTGGASHAKAYEKAVSELIGRGAADLLLKPNNILAVEYLKRMMMWRSKGIDIEPVPVTRKGSGYDDIDVNEGYAGAAKIREMIEMVRDYEDAEYVSGMLEILLPDETASIGRSRGAVEALSISRDETRERLFELIKGILIRSSADEISEIYCIGEGLENKFISEIAKAGSYDELVSAVVSKRYTGAAVRRMLTYIALGLKGADADRLSGGRDRSLCMPYLRVLASSAEGRKYIRALKKRESTESAIITNINRQMPENEPARSMLGLDVKAADLYNALLGRRLYDYSDRVVTPYIDS